MDQQNWIISNQINLFNLGYCEFITMFTRTPMEWTHCNDFDMLKRGT